MTTALAATSRVAIAAIFTRHERVFLSFSGGKDSLTVLHFCEPYRDRHRNKNHFESAVWAGGPQRQLGVLSATGFPA